ncbi:hypothetical protein ACFFX1_45650, partial [Dactylosporangium sucinum]
MNPHHTSPTPADGLPQLPAAGSPLHTAARPSSMRRRAGVGMIAMALLATGGLTACKDGFPGTGAWPGASASTGTGPSASAGPSGPSASVTPVASASASPSGSKSPTPASSSPTAQPSSTTQPPGGGSSPTYTVAGFPAAHNTGYPQGLAGDTRKKVTLTPYTGPMT